MKSIRETAEGIASRFITASVNIGTRRRQLADAIEEALRDRDDRAAKIADEEGCGEAENNCCCAQSIAAAIRKRDVEP